MKISLFLERRWKYPLDENWEIIQGTVLWHGKNSNPILCFVLPFQLAYQSTIWKVATYANMVKLDSFFWLQKIISDKNFPVRDCSVVNQSNKVLTFAFVTWIVEANWNDNKLSFTYLTKYQSHLFVWLLFLHTTVANILEKSVICLVTPGVKN